MVGGGGLAGDGGGAGWGFMLHAKNTATALLKSTTLCTMKWNRKVYGLQGWMRGDPGVACIAPQSQLYFIEVHTAEFEG